MLPPSQQYFLYQNLQLQLETARLALLRQETIIFHSSLETAVEWINNFFDTEETTASVEESPATQQSSAADQDTAAADIEIEAQVDDVVIEPTVEPTTAAAANGAQRTVH